MNRLEVPRVIETNAVRLRPFREGDAQTLFTVLLGDAEATAWLPMRTHANVAETRAFIAQCEAEWRNGYRYTWALEDAAGSTLLAAISLRPRATARGDRRHHQPARSAPAPACEPCGTAQAHTLVAGATSLVPHPCLLCARGSGRQHADEARLRIRRPAHELGAEAESGSARRRCTALCDYARTGRDRCTAAASAGRRIR